MQNFRYDLTPLLIVDDLAIMRVFYINVLKKIGFSIFYEAGNAAEADKVLKAHQDIKIVISDNAMPRVSGLDLAKNLNDRYSPRSFRFYLLITDAEKSIYAEALKSGVDEIIVKPFTHLQIEQKLRKACIAA